LVQDFNHIGIDFDACRLAEDIHLQNESYGIFGFDHDAGQLRQWACDDPAELACFDVFVPGQGDAGLESLCDLGQFVDELLLIPDFDEAGHPVGPQYFQSVSFVSAEE